MATVNKIQKVGYMDLWDIVKFQISFHCSMNKINLSDSELDCITLLALNGETELTDFCNGACEIDERDRDIILKLEKEIFKTPQSVRNSITKLESLKLILKKGKNKKTINVNPDLNLQVNGNILIEIKFLRKDESKES